MISRVLWCVSIAALLALSPPYAMADVTLKGVNLVGAAFSGDKLPGKYQINYVYPSANDVEQYAQLGMNVIRLSFLWERIQHRLYAPLNAVELKRLDNVVKAARENHVVIILDPHNFAAYRGNPIGTEAVPTSAFADLWRRLATHYHNEFEVAFGLMNEPHLQSPKAWADMAQAAIDAIRSTGGKQLILIPATNYSSAEKWTQKSSEEVSNGEALSHLKDPIDNFIFEAHQYFDSDSSGVHTDCVSDDIGIKRLTPFTEWLHATHNRGFLGEFGAANNTLCLEALKNTLKYMSDHSDVWYGWTYWGAGPWFNDYIFSISPPDPTIHPQIKTLEKFLPAQQ